MQRILVNHEADILVRECSENVDLFRAVSSELTHLTPYKPRGEVTVPSAPVQFPCLELRESYTSTGIVYTILPIVRDITHLGVNDVSGNMSFTFLTSRHSAGQG